MRSLLNVKDGNSYTLLDSTLISAARKQRSSRLVSFVLLLAIVVCVGIASVLWQLRTYLPGGSSALAVQSNQPVLDELRGWEWTFNTSVVYTWVNGSEPVYRQSRLEWGGENRVGGSRDRDNGDLLFSLRSFVQHAPWHTGTIYLVAPHAPVWLDLAHPRIKFVPQDSIVPEAYTPTFSSNVIEQFLYRIPGLTSRFIQINDDCMMMRPLHPSNFFTSDGGVRLFLEAKEIHPPAKPVKGIWLGSVHSSVRLLVQKLGPIQHDWPRFVKHAPFVYHVPILEELHVRFKDALRDTASTRFRGRNDVLTPLLHHTTLTQLGATMGLSYATTSLAEAATDFVLLKWRPSLNQNADALEAVLAEKKPYFVTFNDELGNGNGRKVRLAQAQLRQVYQDMFPHPSPFELPS